MKDTRFIINITPRNLVFRDANFMFEQLSSAEHWSRDHERRGAMAERRPVIMLGEVLH